MVGGFVMMMMMEMTDDLTTSGLAVDCVFDFAGDICLAFSFSVSRRSFGLFRFDAYRSIKVWAFGFGK